MNTQLQTQLQDNPILLFQTCSKLTPSQCVYYWDDLKAAMGDFGWLISLKNMFASVFNWIIDKLNMIPGISLDSIAIEASAPNAPQVAAISPSQPQFQQGGVSQQISNANNSKSTHVGTVNVYPAKGDSGNFINYVEMRS